MKYVALLRAINLGKRRVKMDKLKQIFVSMGFENVETYIASGNVIFETQNTDVTELTSLIQDSLKAELGYQVDTFLRTQAQLCEILSNNPFNLSMNEKTTVYVSFLDTEPSSEAKDNLSELQSDTYTFKIINKELYTLRILDEDQASVFSNNLIEKVLKVSATTRNINTVDKLAFI